MALSAASIAAIKAAKAALRNEKSVLVAERDNLNTVIASHQARRTEINDRVTTINAQLTALSADLTEVPDE